MAFASKATNLVEFDTNGKADVFAYDRQTGTIRAHVPLTGTDLHLTNVLTDRIYVGTRNGKLVCLRESQMERPAVHIPWSPEESQQDEQPAPADSAAEEDLSVRGASIRAISEMMATLLTDPGQRFDEEGQPISICVNEA